MSDLILPELVNEDFENKLVEDLHEDIYHADKTAIGSSSIKHLLVSPATFLYHYTKPKTAEETEKEKEHFKFGRLVHKALLEGSKFKDSYVVMPEFMDYTEKGVMSAQSKGAKQKRAEWLEKMKAENKTICTEEERDHLIGMANAVLNHKDVFRILKEGKPEITGYYRDPETGIKCKIRPDFLPFTISALPDLKTARSSDRNDFSKAVWNYRYDIQMAMYCYAIYVITGRKIKHPSYIVIEKEPPYEVALYVCDNTVMEVGLSDYKRGLRILKECLLTKKWPQRQTSIQEIGLPTWALNGDY